MSGDFSNDLPQVIAEILGVPTLTPEGHRWVARYLADGLFRPPTDVIAYFGLDPETDWLEVDE